MPPLQASISEYPWPKTRFTPSDHHRSHWAPGVSRNPPTNFVSHPRERSASPKEGFRRLCHAEFRYRHWKIWLQGVSWYAALWLLVGILGFGVTWFLRHPKTYYWEMVIHATFSQLVVPALLMAVVYIFRFQELYVRVPIPLRRPLSLSTLYQLVQKGHILARWLGTSSFMAVVFYSHAQHLARGEAVVSELRQPTPQEEYRRSRMYVQEVSPFDDYSLYLQDNADNDELRVNPDMLRYYFFGLLLASFYHVWDHVQGHDICILRDIGSRSLQKVNLGLFRSLDRAVVVTIAAYLAYMVIGVMAEWSSAYNFFTRLGLYLSIMPMSIAAGFIGIGALQAMREAQLEQLFLPLADNRLDYALLLAGLRPENDPAFRTSAFISLARRSRRDRTFRRVVFDQVQQGAFRQLAVECIEELSRFADSVEDFSCTLTEMQVQDRKAKRQRKKTSKALSRLSKSLALQSEGVVTPSSFKPSDARQATFGSVSWVTPRAPRKRTNAEASIWNSGFKHTGNANQQLDSSPQFFGWDPAVSLVKFGETVHGRWVSIVRPLWRRISTATWLRPFMWWPMRERLSQMAASFVVSLSATEALAAFCASSMEEDRSGTVQTVLPDALQKMLGLYEKLNAHLAQLVAFEEESFTCSPPLIPISGKPNRLYFQNHAMFDHQLQQLLSQPATLTELVLWQSKVRDWFLLDYVRSCVRLREALRLRIDEIGLCFCEYLGEINLGEKHRTTLELIRANM